jgi:hypothetical protein
MTEVLTATEVNCTTGEVIVRPLTGAEIAQMEADAQTAAERRAVGEAAATAEAEAKASAEAKLTALGLTAEEIAALTK